MMKRPSFQFYPSDWLGDTALKACSYDAKGLWMDLLCLMHEGNPYGTLTLPNGKPIDQKMLKKMLNFDQKMAKKFPKLIQELIENGVMKQLEMGVFYSSRMTKDEAERESWRERQAKARGVKTENNHESVTPTSRRSSSSSSSSKLIPPTPKGAVSRFDDFWKAYPKKTAKEKALAIWKRDGLDAIAQAIIDALLLVRVTEGWTKENGRYIPNPTTWLNGKRWEDELTVESPAIIKPENKYLQAHNAGRRFFHEGMGKTFRAEELKSINFSLKRPDKVLDGFLTPDGDRWRFEHFTIEEDYS